MNAGIALGLQPTDLANCTKPNDSRRQQGQDFPDPGVSGRLRGY